MKLIGPLPFKQARVTSSFSEPQAVTGSPGAWERPVRCAIRGTGRARAGCFPLMPETR